MSEFIENTSEPIDPSIIEESLLSEIPTFENFLSQIGFKRTEGAVFGLLVLSKRPLTYEEIEKVLCLSQPAVNSAIKKLHLYGAVESRELRDRKIKVHFAKEDSLSIVATVFRKREQEIIEQFRLMANRVLAKKEFENTSRSRRLKSIIATCEIAESVMNFVISLAAKSETVFYDDIVKNLPRVLEILSNGQDHVSNVAQSIKSALFNKFQKISGEHNE